MSEFKPGSATNFPTDIQEILTQEDAVVLQAFISPKLGRTIISGSEGEVWAEFSMWMEALCVAASRAADVKKWNKEETFEYMKEYLLNALPTYFVK